ncbi:hypothetical protein BCR33DRAFT_370086 [Rhizoclosmatium globosum]|uniref:Amino acid permease/ SLC12A domain-containing protein n=1 Tax=Rhizoclosmatium globosum TaxID=329046 RepID=A0A1Y2BZC4_9FUNG|nr:hypothetical protein BCR33DRAFT_370086 [Rhizoclosmatium globosum]|eukprot:ORY40120.1 hypothetical protein BCR33DRAFT_370086 [Rhizoclosmatium globosum]
MDRKEKSGVNLTTRQLGLVAKWYPFQKEVEQLVPQGKPGRKHRPMLRLERRKGVYLEKRKLLPAFAKSIHVWGFVVGTVISGEFVGFNSAYAYGLGSMIVAHVFTSLLMITVSLTLTELATAMPFASGSASYANAAFHGSVACIIGYAYTFDMVFIGAEATNFVGIAFQTIFNTELQYNVLYWIASVLLCSVINLSPKLTLNLLVCLSAISCLLAVIPLCVVSQNFDFSSVFNTTITYSDGTTAVSTAFLPYGIKVLFYRCRIRYTC